MNSGSATDFGEERVLDPLSTSSEITQDVLLSRTGRPWSPDYPGFVTRARPFWLQEIFWVIRVPS